jgi:hypothetical protein
MDRENASSSNFAAEGALLGSASFSSYLLVCFLFAILIQEKPQCSHLLAEELREQIYDYCLLNCFFRRELEIGYWHLLSFVLNIF